MAIYASSSSGGPTGRVLVDGRDRGAGFALLGRLVVTANHVVRDRAERSIAFVPFGAEEIRVSTVEGDDVLDVAVLELERDVERTLPVARAVGQPAWRVETRPKKSDPVLSGRVIDTARLVVNAKGQEIEFVQLHVDQQLGDYGGYSGSPVVLDSPRDAVIGVLVEQQRWRQGASPGQPAPAANVLYATPVAKVIARFAIEESVRLAHPQRFDVPRPPTGLVERPLLLDRLLGSLEGAASDVILVRGMPGMGKTVLSRKAAHHSRTWRAYPGGIVEHVVGEGDDADEVLNRLRARLAIGTGALDDAFSDDATLVILDDVWSDEVIGTLRERTFLMWSRCSSRLGACASKGPPSSPWTR